MAWEIPDYIREILVTLRDNGYQGYLVGGSVRDMLRGIKPQDWDLATNAKVEEIQRMFGQTINTGIEFGTITVVHRGINIEVTTFRLDGAYADQRHPSTVTFINKIEADLARRDFTINAMAYDIFTDRLIDPFGGRDDLREGIIRAVGDPKERFREDALRMLRAVRFSGQIRANIEEKTWEAIVENKTAIGKIAPERIRDEFNKIITVRETQAGLDRLYASGLLSIIMPDIHRDEMDYTPATAVAVCSVVSPRLAPRLTALLLGHRNPGDFLKRLRYPNKICSRVMRSKGIIDDLILQKAVNPPLARLYLSKIAAEEVQDLESLLEGFLKVPGFRLIAKGKIKKLLSLLAKVAAEDFPRSPTGLAIKGDDLMDCLGIEEGPLVGVVLRALWRDVLREPGLNCRSALLERGKELLSREKNRL